MRGFPLPAVAQFTVAIDVKYLQPAIGIVPHGQAGHGNALRGTTFSRHLRRQPAGRKGHNRHLEPGIHGIIALPRLQL